MKSLLKNLLPSLILLFVVSGCGKHQGQNSATNQTKISENYIAETASYLAYSYHSNEVRADEVYKGKVLLITGEITDIGKTSSDAPYIILSGNREDSKTKIDVNAQVIFQRQRKNEVSQLNKGDIIKVKANCDGLTLGNVILSDAELR